VRRAFTLIELLVVVAIIAILAALLLPSLASAKGKAKSVQCVRQMSQLSLASSMYTEDQEERFVLLARLGRSPSGAFIANTFYTWWPDLLRGYSPTPKILDCPGQTTRFGIGINHSELALWGTGRVSVAEVMKPAATVLFADSGSVQYLLTTNSASVSTNSTNSASPIFFRTPGHVCLGQCRNGPLAERHNKRVNAGFVDGHVETLKGVSLGLQFPAGNAQALWDKQ
jgi:prepilin-type N-terminal cleavage/methylation domain-containing protein/prepilin-type processing-associated H-X9-DG protein